MTYGNPALAAPDTPCPGGRDGFDVHPAFGADGERLRQAVDFVSRTFLPGIKALARCEDGKSCRDPATERMTFVDGHQPAFASARRLRARGRRSAIRSRMLFGNGESFDSSLTKGGDRPDGVRLSGERIPSLRIARALGPDGQRQLLHRMTYPEGLPALLQPSDLHDAIWGIFAAVYGGAVHPTAEGHAAMADAALPAVREVLGLRAVAPVVASHCRRAPMPAPAAVR